MTKCRFRNIKVPLFQHQSATFITQKCHFRNTRVSLLGTRVPLFQHKRVFLNTKVPLDRARVSLLTTPTCRLASTLMSRDDVKTACLTPRPISQPP